MIITSSATVDYFFLPIWQHWFQPTGQRSYWWGRLMVRTAKWSVQVCCLIPACRSTAVFLTCPPFHTLVTKLSVKHRLEACSADVTFKIPAKVQKYSSLCNTLHLKVNDTTPSIHPVGPPSSLHLEIILVEKSPHLLAKHFNFWRMNRINDSVGNLDK